MVFADLQENKHPVFYCYGAFAYVRILMLRFLPLVFGHKAFTRQALKEY